VAHGFGLRDAPTPAGLLRPVQVHGSAVVVLRAKPRAALGEADAVVSSLAGVAVGVVTADCVPVLLASSDGSAVAAVHAGWRGLAAGVVEAGVRSLASLGAAPLRAAVGPCIGACCYEVDDPVLDALRGRFGAALDAALLPSRQARALLDLAALARAALRGAGVRDADIETVPDACTRCDAPRFHSARRDGREAGRLVHWIAARRDP